jgi:hypothetical protein
MKYLDELHVMVQEMADSQKATAIIAATTTSVGLFTAVDLLRGAASVAAVIIGMIATGILARLNWVRVRNEELNNAILRKQAADMGIDLGAEK